MILMESYNVSQFFFQKSPEGRHCHFTIELLRGHLVVTQNLNGETLVGNINISFYDLTDHDVHVIITTTHTTVSLETTESCMLGVCKVTLGQNLIGQELYLNEGLYIGGVPEITPYLRSKLSTFKGFTGCFGVSAAVILFTHKAPKKQTTKLRLQIFEKLSI